jgi:general stress protein 26
METAAIKKRTLELVKECVVGDLATTDGKTPYQRQMMTIGTDDDGTIYFSTFRGSRKVGQIEANAGVSILYSTFKGDMMNWEAVTVAGTGKVTDEKALRERFWMPEFTRYYPGGVDDPNYVIIVVKPCEARYQRAGEMMENVASY